ncbi:Protein N-acetyltransferase, RimJ/RimL family [Methanolobus vulcani]|jgi:Acetyltransferases, including N-acetylases of ribosomal proteins|uniref:Protein N-acetyltransferase, RimJ/RimL family n=2 Tax=Methanolobus vulcani TaxID=38026 RepID=A0A7Z7AVI1_9EURY|nr:Protein N-acetyltransferase, RimJ/RimL family [Methanolobus vulcani]
MYRPFIVGMNIYLRGLERSDIEDPYFQWLNDREVTQFMESGNFPNTLEDMESFFQSNSLNKDTVIFAIIDSQTDKHIGNVKLGPINWISRNSHMGIMIGDKASWGKGYGYECVKLIVDYAFNVLNLHKVMLGVVEQNKAALKLYQKVGFTIEGICKEQFNLDGKYCDVLYMGLLKRDYLTTNGSICFDPDGIDFYVD